MEGGGETRGIRGGEEERGGIRKEQYRRRGRSAGSMGGPGCKAPVKYANMRKNVCVLSTTAVPVL